MDEFSGKAKADCCPYKCHLHFVQVPAEDDTQMIDDDNDQRAGDSNIDGDQQSEDDELCLASVIQ